MEREGNRPGTIVTAIVKRPVTAAPDVRFAAQGIRRPDRVLYALRRMRWCIRDAATQNRAGARHHRPIAPLFDAADFLFPFLILLLIVLLRSRWCGLRAP